MNAEIKTKWIEALKSGKYAKGVKALNYTDDNGVQRYCCLGVLCDLYIQETKIGAWKDSTSSISSNIKRKHFYKDDYNLGSAFLPAEVREWADMYTPSAGFIDKDNLFNPEDNMTSLVAVNDGIEAEDFSEVIKVIEHYF